MSDTSSLNHCLSFISSQLRPAAEAPTEAERKLAVTLSRQTGAGAWLVAPRLAEILQRAAPPATGRWTVFDGELVEKVLQDHNLPSTLARFMPEDKVSFIEDAVTELLGLHPPSWTLLEKTRDTVRKLAQLGNVILIGRGANVITTGMPHVFHVRLVGSLDRRIACVREHLQMDEKGARDFVEKTDRGRQRYFRDHFSADLENPLLYDLTINTDRVPYARAARVIALAALEKVGQPAPREIFSEG